MAQIKLLIPRTVYTEADELCASTVQPIHRRHREAMLKSIRESLDNIARDAATRIDLRAIVDTLNVVEGLLKAALFEDPEGLHRDAHDRVAATCKAVLEEGARLRFDEQTLNDVTDVIDGYEQMLTALPARAYIRVFRQVERRLQGVWNDPALQGVVAAA